MKIMLQIMSAMEFYEFLSFVCLDMDENLPSCINSFNWAKNYTEHLRYIHTEWLPQLLVLLNFLLSMLLNKCKCNQVTLI